MDWTAIRGAVHRGEADCSTERYAPSASARDVMQGFGIASAALVLGGVIGNRSLGEGHRGYAYGVAGVASLTGIYASIQRQRRPTIAANVLENRRRQDERARANAAIAERNARRVAAMHLVLKPAAGIGP